MEEKSAAVLNGRDLAQKDFIGEGAIDVGGVEEGDAARSAVEGGHAHAAKPLCRNLEAL